VLNTLMRAHALDSSMYRETTTAYINVYLRVARYADVTQVLSPKHPIFPQVTILLLVIRL